ncbi:MAG: polysulfide reductase NrfD [Deltaproteobacteria bacterium]|nr:polysulfide reductase NrfD [Deltaproteobacteria bacterium]
MKRVVAFKSFLFFLVGVAVAIALFRFWQGLGATTALTDLTPWGFWIGFDVMGGVALAAGGFVVAATVYIFHLDKYHAIVRPAVLTAFLGYLAVIVGLLFDLGLPWHIFNMIVFWNPHSPLFEVGWCVMLYTGVLGLEFAPTVLEMAKHPTLSRVYGFLKKATLPLVLLGIMLSTLHQSSLGSLILIMPHRLHALWYTPILPILFFVSAIGLGIMMVTVESLLSSWLYEQKPEMPQLKGLTKAAAWVLWIYTAIKLVDLGVRGELGTLFAFSFESNLFLFEFLLSAIIPATLLSIPAVRASFGWMATAAGMGVIGFVMNRVDVGGVGMIGTTGTRYVPAWTEIAVSLGIVAGFALIYFFVAERFNLFHAGPMKAERFRFTLPDIDPSTATVRPDPYWGGSVRYSLLFVVGCAVAVAMLPDSAFSGNALKQDPVTAPGFGERMILDGNRTGEAVLFEHAKHVDREGGQASCATCHHLVRPGEQATGCAHCHRDMMVPTSIFDHDMHADRLEAGPGCTVCHASVDDAKDLAHSKPCLDCHTGMAVKGSRIKLESAPRIGYAKGYADAMHGLCVKCHEERALDPKVGKPVLGQCASCHAGKAPVLDPMKPDQRIPSVAEGSESGSLR